MNRSPAALYLEDVAAQFRSYKGLADRALAQVRDEGSPRGPRPGVEQSGRADPAHGGQPDLPLDRLPDHRRREANRDRDSEFLTREGTTRADLLARWESGWSRLFQALSELTEEDLTRTITIRAEPHSVIRAIDRQLMHQAYHTGQIVLLAKHFASTRWRTLSVPRGKTRSSTQRCSATCRSHEGVPLLSGERTN